jgi:hypothetical protein
MAVFSQGKRRCDKSSTPQQQGNCSKPAASRNPENKLQKPVLFSAPQKMTSRGPRLPRIPPQLHHVFTTANTLKLQISPIKTAFHHANLFPQKTVESKHGNQPQRSSRLLSK